MIRVEIDKGDYSPAKKVNTPYLGITEHGRTVLVRKIHGRTAEAIVLQRGNEQDPYSVGDMMPALALTSVTPISEGEHLVLSNTWEIANG